jgi:hypothetical protein
VPEAYHKLVNLAAPEALAVLAQERLSVLLNRALVVAALVDIRERAAMVQILSLHQSVSNKVPAANLVEAPEELTPHMLAPFKPK